MKESECERWNIVMGKEMGDKSNEERWRGGMGTVEVGMLGVREVPTSGGVMEWRGGGRVEKRGRERRRPPLPTRYTAALFVVLSRDAASVCSSLLCLCSLLVTLILAELSFHQAFLR